MNQALKLCTGDIVIARRNLQASEQVKELAWICALGTSLRELWPIEMVFSCCRVLESRLAPAVLPQPMACNFTWHPHRPSHTTSRISELQLASFSSNTLTCSTGTWRNQHNEELHDSYSSPSTGWHRKTGTFVKQIQIEYMQQQKILLTVIEPLQLAN
jgi:hypothetical protein